MSKFGELLDEKIPILLAFFRSQESESQDMNPVLKDVAAALGCLLYTSPSPRDRQKSRMPSSA